ncbi:hypothetical protein EDC04DRAFT_2601700 [Pisolithus marmoratus]|nr:hypothetical protein EDC04DRAFT_2601700 [Pisolithus marmoratus]
MPMAVSVSSMAMAACHFSGVGIELLCSWILGMYYVVWCPSGACQARYPLAWKWQGRWNVSGIDFCVGMTMFHQAKRLVFWQMLGCHVMLEHRMCATVGLYDLHPAVRWTISHLKVMCAEALESMVQMWSGTLVVEDVRVNFAHSFSVHAFCHMVLADFISAAVGAWQSPVKDSSIKMKILCACEVVADMEAP